MLHNGYMYVIETPSGPAEKSGIAPATPSYAVIAGGSSKNKNKTEEQQAFVPVAVNMPDGVDVERMYPCAEWSENQSDTNSTSNSTDTKTTTKPATTANNKQLNNKNQKEQHQKDNKTTKINNSSENKKLPQEQQSLQNNGYISYQHTAQQAHPQFTHATQHYQQQQHFQKFQPAHPYAIQAHSPHPTHVPVVYMMPAAPGYGQPPPQAAQMAPWGMNQQASAYPHPPPQYMIAANSYGNGYYDQGPLIQGFNPYGQQAGGPPPQNAAGKYHGYKRGSVGGYDHTYNPLKAHHGKGGPFRNNKDKSKEKHHKEGKLTSTEKSESSSTSTPKKTKSLQSSSTDPASKTNTSRSNSSNSDLSLGCSASQNGSNTHRHSRSCSHDSGVSHKTPQESSNHSQCDDGKASITATINGGRCDSHESAKSSSSRRFSNNGEFKKPDEELVKKIIDLIEFYLSDEYLAKDKYLLRQIRCKSEGYISIKLMTSFKKVKKLTRDWRTVRYALLRSKNLEISPEGFRVKRAIALPDALRKPRLLSSVVSIRLPLEYQSVDAITNLFSKYGEIGLVRLLKPGKEIPSDLRNYATQVPDIGKSLCAVVDFEQSEAALQAVRCLKEKLMDCGMRLALLGPRVRRTLYKQDRADGDTNSTRSDDASKDETTCSVSLAAEQDESSPPCSKTTSCEHDEEEEEEERVEKENQEQEQTEIVEQVTHVEELPKIEEEEEQQPTIVKQNTSFDSGTAADDKTSTPEVVKIKSKVSIILREPKCPPMNQTESGFSRQRQIE